MPVDDVALRHVIGAPEIAGQQAAGELQPESGAERCQAVGAGDALRMVLREGLWLTAIGSGIGLLLSVALGTALAGMLYQVSGVDPVVLATAPTLLAAVSVLASYVPARRAAAIDPMVALRHE